MNPPNKTPGEHDERDERDDGQPPTTQATPSSCLEEVLQIGRSITSEDLARNAEEARRRQDKLVQKMARLKQRQADARTTAYFDPSQANGPSDTTEDAWFIHNKEADAMEIPSVQPPPKPLLTRRQVGLLALSALGLGGTIAYLRSRTSSSVSEFAQRAGETTAATTASPEPAPAIATNGPTPPTAPLDKPKSETPLSATDTKAATPAPAPTLNPAPKPEPAEITEKPIETTEENPRIIPISLDRAGGFQEMKSIKEWENAGYEVTMGVNPKGENVFVLKKTIGTFVVNPAEHIKGKTKIIARRAIQNQ